MTHLAQQVGVVLVAVLAWLIGDMLGAATWQTVALAAFGGVLASMWIDRQDRRRR